MREFQDKKRFKKVLYSRTAVVVLLILIVFFAHATWGIYQKEQESKANAVEASLELKKLDDRQTVLDSEIDRLNTPEGVEEEIRSKYSVSKPGENMIIIVDDTNASTSTTTAKEGWWDKFKKLFK